MYKQNVYTSSFNPPTYHLLNAEIIDSPKIERLFEFYDILKDSILGENDKDFAIVGAVPVDAEGITYIYGRQSCDTRAMEGGTIDQGNAKYGGQEAMVIFEDVFNSKL